MHYVYAHVRVRTDDRSLYSGGQHVASHKAMPLQVQPHHARRPGFSGSGSSHTMPGGPGSQAAAHPSQAQAPLLSMRWSKAGEVLARVLAPEL